MNGILTLDVKRVTDFTGSNEMTTESVFGDFIEDVGDGMSGVLSFLKHMVTLDMRKYFEDKHQSEIALNLLRAKRYVDNNDKTIGDSFSTALEDDVYVAIGFDVRWKPIIELLDKNFLELTKNNKALIDEFNSEVGKIISSSKYRNGKESLSSLRTIKKKAYEVSNEKIIDIDNDLSSYLGVGTKVKLSKACSTVAELIDNINVMNDIIKNTDERDLKESLKSITNTTQRISVMQDLVEKGDISKEMEDVFNHLVVHFANSITVSGKLYHSMYELSIALTKVVNEHLK